MPLTITSAIAKNKFSWFMLVIFSGLTLGFLILFFFAKLGLTIATFCSLGIIFPFLTIIAGDSKRLLLLFLCLFLTVSVDMTLNHSGHVGGAAGVMISFYDIILAILYLLWFIEIISKKKAKIDFFPEISIPFIALLGLSSLSAISAKYPELCLYEIIEIFKMYLTFIYLANNIKTKNDVLFILSIFMLSLFLEGLLGFAQHRYEMPFFPTALGGPAWIGSRVSGTWRSYNDFAWYLTFFLPLSMCLIFSETKTIVKLLCLLTSAVASGALLWTSSRAGWLSLGVSSLFVGFLIICKINEKKSLITLFLTVLLILVLILPLYPRIYSKIYGRFSMDDKGSATSRLQQFQVAFNIIKANPIIGVGINNYSENIKKYDDTEEGIEQFTIFPVHNIFLHITAEIGIFGLSIFIWILTVIFFKGVNYIMQNNGVLVYSVIGMLAGILAFLIHGLFDVASFGSKMFLFMWFFSGIIFAVGKIKTD